MKGVKLRFGMDRSYPAVMLRGGPTWLGAAIPSPVLYDCVISQTLRTFEVSHFSELLWLWGLGSGDPRLLPAGYMNAPNGVVL